MERDIPPDAAADRAILFLHGGGYMLGSAHRHLAGHVAARAGSNAFVPAYALAPERPFPAAFDDALAAHRALARGTGRLALAAALAGGGLALAIPAGGHSRSAAPSPGRGGGGVAMNRPGVDGREPRHVCGGRPMDARPAKNVRGGPRLPGEVSRTAQVI